MCCLAESDSSVSTRRPRLVHTVHAGHKPRGLIVAEELIQIVVLQDLRLALFTGFPKNTVLQGSDNYKAEIVHVIERNKVSNG
jgi:hypothetical protein